MVTAFDRGDDAAFISDFRQAQDPVGLMRDVVHAVPWPAAPRRQQVFALETAAAGLLAGTYSASRSDAIELLIDEDAQVRRAPGPGQSNPANFECTWRRAEIALLEGSLDTDAADQFLALAQKRCPGDPELSLDQAIILDQRASGTMRGLEFGAAESAADDLPQIRQVMDLYSVAAGSPETRVSARLHQAWLFVQLGRPHDALSLLPSIAGQAKSREAQYFEHVVQGQARLAIGQPAEAAVSFRAALSLWPSAQSARVGLISALIDEGDRSGAAALADRAETAPEGEDPWPWFIEGSAYTFTSRIADLRQLTQ